MFEYAGYINDTCSYYDKDDNEQEFDFRLRIEKIWVDNYGDWGFSRDNLDKALDSSNYTEDQKGRIVDYLNDTYWVDDDYYWYTNGNPCAYTGFCDHNYNNILEYDILSVYFDDSHERRLLVKFDNNMGEWALYNINSEKFSSLYWLNTAPGVKILISGNIQRGDKLDLSNIDTRAERI